MKFNMFFSRRIARSTSTSPRVLECLERRVLFAAGDLRSQLTRQVTTASGDGTTAAIAVDKYIKGLRDAAGSPSAKAAEAVETVHVNAGGYS